MLEYFIIMLKNFNFITCTVPHNEIVDVVVSVRVSRLQGKNGRVRGCIQLHHSLHGQRAVDEIRRFIIDIPHVNNYALVVGICEKKIVSCQKRSKFLTFVPSKTSFCSKSAL